MRQLEAVSRSEGCPKYAGVISFDNAYLRQNNFIVGNQLNRQALIEAARKGINKMIDKSEKLDASNCYWVGSIHVNTGNVHIHYQLLEYHRLEDRRITYKNKGQDDIEQKAFNALKTEMTHFIDKSAAAANLTEFQRNVLAPHIKSEFAGSIQKINALIDKLPDDLKNSGKQWWYAKQNDVTKNEIDSCIRSVISENKTLQIMFDTYLHKLDSTQSMFRNRYGQNSRWAEYKEVPKNKPCKRNNRQISDNTKIAAKQGNAEERPDAGCEIKRWKAAAEMSSFFNIPPDISKADKPQEFEGGTLISR